MSSRDEHKITRLQQLIHNLQIQFESSVPVFVLGGIDCILNVLRCVISIVVFTSYPISSGSTVGIYLYQFLVKPFDYCQIISHSVTYGVYKKDVRKRLHQFYQRLQRMVPLHPSKVVTLHPQ